MLDTAHWLKQHGTHLLQSIGLIGGMALLLGALGWTIAGVDGVWLALALTMLLLMLSPGVPPRLLLRLYGAVPLPPVQAPDLYAMTTELSRRAGLDRPPALYYLPSHVANALTLGGRDYSHIALTDGLLRRMNRRELAGVLAHEISHIRHSDIRLMELADLFQRITHGLALTGQLLLLLSLPLYLFGEFTISWLTIALLILAPALATLLLLGLSRVREFDADLGAVRLTGDPAGLASALARLETPDGNWLRRLLMPSREQRAGNLLRTHPATRERIRRLSALVAEPGPSPFRAAPVGRLGNPFLDPRPPPRHGH